VIDVQPAGPDAPELLFLGEGQNSARYLDGVLQSAYRVTRVFASQPLGESPEADRLGAHAVYILSDYPSANLTDAQQARLIEAVERDGRGLLMIGGWSSFAGPRGSYHGTRLAEILPVEVAAEDDRTNTPLGTVLVSRRAAHPAIATVQGEIPCCVAGFNAVRARPEAEVLIEGHQLVVQLAPATGPTAIATAEGLRYSQQGIPGGPRASLENGPTPMLTVWQRGKGRVAAFAPDVSPHWAGGIVDWGPQRLKLPTGSEIGHLYKAFLLDLCHWLGGA
jgi:uncharacterized membrane protein